jgi:hypothetical protein
MKPKEIIEKEKLGYIELSKEQIEKYIINDEVTAFFGNYGSVCFSYDYQILNLKGTLHFKLKTSYDCDVEVKKKWFGLFEDKIYNIKTDIYYYNDDLKIFFEDKGLKKINPYSNDFLEMIKNELKNKND